MDKKNKQDLIPSAKGGGGVVLPYISYIGMCCANGYGFLALLAI